jgi:hypothetical protein
VESDALVIAARFDPPDAHRRFNEWRAVHEPVLRYLASGQILVDVGRAVGGDFVRVWLPPEVAARVAKEQF